MRQESDMYTADTTTMPRPLVGHGVFYIQSMQGRLPVTCVSFAVSAITGEIDVNVTEEASDLAGNVVLIQASRAQCQRFETRSGFDTSAFSPQPQQLTKCVTAWFGRIFDADGAGGHANTDAGPIWVITPQETPVKISPEAERRILGREQLLQRAYNIIRDEARNKSMPLSHVEVLSDWSNEYDEHTGVVIYVEMRGTADDRFALWDTLANRLEDLEGSLSPDERDFLKRRVSVVVNRV